MKHQSLSKALVLLCLTWVALACDHECKRGCVDIDHVDS